MGGLYGGYIVFTQEGEGDVYRVPFAGYGRNTSATGFFAVPFDGVTFAGRNLYSVPDGQYVLKLTVTKALGVDDNPAHTDDLNLPRHHDRPPVIPARNPRPTRGGGSLLPQLPARTNGSDATMR